MPSKKKVEPVEVVPQILPDAGPVTIGTEKAEKIFEQVKRNQTCGHTNKQHYGASGRLEDLACTLPAGHSGDHQATYKKKVGEPVTDEKGRVVKTVYHEEDALSAWGDAAGTPARPANGLEIEQTSLLQKDLIMQVLKEHPDWKVEQAMAQAKADPRWNAAALS